MSFGRFAERAAQIVASAKFFAVCVLIIALWAPSFLIVGNIDTWRLVINTTTTIITFLMVALLQNSQKRFEDRCDEREDLMAEAVSTLLHDLGNEKLARQLQESSNRS